MSPAPSLPHALSIVAALRVPDLPSAFGLRGLPPEAQVFGGAVLLVVALWTFFWSVRQVHRVPLGSTTEFLVERRGLYALVLEWERDGAPAVGRLRLGHLVLGRAKVRLEMRAGREVRLLPPLGAKPSDLWLRLPRHDLKSFWAPRPGLYRLLMDVDVKRARGNFVLVRRARLWVFPAVVLSAVAFVTLRLAIGRL